jgi:hypothetical protein
VVLEDVFDEARSWWQIKVEIWAACGKAWSHFVPALAVAENCWSISIGWHQGAADAGQGLQWSRARRRVLKRPETARLVL